MDVDSHVELSSIKTKFVSQEQSKYYLAQYKKFEQSLKKQAAAFDSISDRKYYIVSTIFLDEYAQFCKSKMNKRKQPVESRVYLLDENGKLKDNAAEKQDFLILNSHTYKYLSEFEKKPIIRYAYNVGNEKKIGLCTNKYNYITVTRTVLKDIEYSHITAENFEIKQLELHPEHTVKDAIEIFLNIMNLHHNISSRIWRITVEWPISKLYADFQKKLKNTTDYRIGGLGKLCNMESTIGDLQIEPGEYFLVECKQTHYKWHLTPDNVSRCQGCYDYLELKFPCQCKKVSYCTESCRDKDRRFHLRDCEFEEMKELNQPINMTISANSKHGLVGLRNIGNTCFMNSCLQCMSNIRPLTLYFSKNFYQQEVNKQNPLGSQGRLAKCYAKFISAMWCGNKDIYEPAAIKKAVSKLNPMFSGYCQHDSHEFFSFLTDGLHQDLNRIIKKPYVEAVNSNDMPDQQIALQSWKAYLKRNQSIIIDLMAGQYKSKVKCPDCKNESITFDPYITVTLPIPQKHLNNLQVYAIFSNIRQKTKKISFLYKKPDLKEWTQKAAEMLGIPSKNITFYLMTINEGIYKVGRQSISEIIHKIECENKNLFLVELSQEEANMQNPIEFTVRFSQKNYYSQYENLWFKYPFFFEKQGLTGLHLVKKGLKFLYRGAYEDCFSQSNKKGDTEEKYIEKMLKSRPFKVVLRWNRKLEKYYHYDIVKYTYEDEVEIQDDTDVMKLLAGKKDYELDYQLSRHRLEVYDFRRMKSFQDQRDNYKDTTPARSKVTLQECWRDFQEPEFLEPDNQWYCPKCKEHKLAEKQLFLYKAPDILILHLKRFKPKGSYRKEKNTALVQFPLSLDLAPYLLDSTPMSSYNEILKNEQILKNANFSKEQINATTGKPPLYKLFGVINHIGGLGGGHYTACGFNQGEWYEFDDSHVSKCSPQEIIGPQAYILFYQRQ